MTFPAFIDSTMLNDYRSCEAKWAFRHLQHLVPATANVHLNAGGAFAKAMEVSRKSFYVQKNSQEKAVIDGVRALLTEYGDFDMENEKKSWDATAGAFLYYTDMFPFATDLIQPYLLDDGKRATVEFSFALPLPILHPETNEPMLYTGRFDMLGQYMGQAFCVDEKTTGRIDRHWSEKWQLRGQFIGYAWAAREHGYTVAGTIVRGVAIYKEAFNIQEVPVYAPAWKVDEWLASTILVVNNMIAVYKTGKYNKAFNDACSAYAGCSYTRLCDTPNPDRWIHPYYVEKVWNPITKENETV